MTSPNYLRYALVLVFTIIAPTQAQTLDQSHEPAGSNQFAVSLGQDLAQIFTAGASGLLTDIDVGVLRLGIPGAGIPAQNVAIDLRPVDAVTGAPGDAASVLGSLSLMPSEVPTTHSLLSSTSAPSESR